MFPANLSLESVSGIQDLFIDVPCDQTLHIGTLNNNEHVRIGGNSLEPAIAITGNEINIGQGRSSVFVNGVLLQTLIKQLAANEFGDDSRYLPVGPPASMNPNTVSVLPSGFTDGIIGVRAPQNLQLPKITRNNMRIVIKDESLQGGINMMAAAGDLIEGQQWYSLTGEGDSINLYSASQTWFIY